MIDSVFDGCVQLLVFLADLTGTSYKEINVWIFCVLWPIFTLLLVAVVGWQWLRIRILKRAARPVGASSPEDQPVPVASGNPNAE